MHIEGLWFKDGEGRTLILRGVNLGGSSKVPATPDGATYRSEGFYDHRTVSFVGRPFPLAEADEHFARLRAWGLTFVRFLVTWEAIEHAGPGQYDRAYVDYVRAVLQKANEYGIQCFIDPHQDVWSRWTGGDGAPGWTLEAVGFDLEKLHVTGAAISHQTHGDPLPRMIWPTNYYKLAAATLFTLFFAGDTFAPNFRIGGVTAQQYLQSHYINAICYLASHLQDLPNVVGYDSMNEPGIGYLAQPDLSAFANPLPRIGAMPTPLQGMALGAGLPQDVEIWSMDRGLPELLRVETLNPGGVRVWREGYDCVWKQHGVWTDEGGQARLLRPDYFATSADPLHQFLRPFVLRYQHAIREIDPDALIFIGNAPAMGHMDFGDSDPGGIVQAGHWYDGLSLFTKSFNPEFSIDVFAGTLKTFEGEDEVQASFVEAIRREVSATRPTLIGEFGLQFDMNDGQAYTTGDFGTQAKALSMYINALDTHLLSFALWNYTADNTNARGDLWNDEDLSIFSRDQQTDPSDINSGGRGVLGFVRPYARKVAGLPRIMRFDPATRTFTLEYRGDPEINAPTEIFIPAVQYPNGYKVTLSDGEYRTDGSYLYVWQYEGRDTHTVTVTPA